LDLLKLASRRTAEFGAGPPKVMRCDAWNTGSRGVLLKQLPDDLLAHTFTLDLIPSVDGAECESINEARCRGPGIDCNLDPGRHRNRTNAALLTDKVNDASAIVPLLDVPERKSRCFRSAEAAAEQDGQYGTIP
jgi:hypothetical protein